MPSGHGPRRGPRERPTLLDDFTRGRDDADLAALTAQANVRAITGDVTDAATWASLGRFDEVYHLAAIVGVRNVIRQPGRVLHVNAMGTLRLLDWCGGGGARRLLFASTSEVYAFTQLFHPLPVPTDEIVPLDLFTDLADPRCTYAASKIFGELAVTQMCAAADTPFVIVRYHNVYGPRMGARPCGARTVCAAPRRRASTRGLLAESPPRVLLCERCREGRRSPPCAPPAPRTARSTSATIGRK